MGWWFSVCVHLSPLYHLAALWAHMSILAILALICISCERFYKWQRQFCLCSFISVWESLCLTPEACETSGQVRTETLTDDFLPQSLRKQLSVLEGRTGPWPSVLFKSNGLWFLWPSSSLSSMDSTFASAQRENKTGLDNMWMTVHQFVLNSCHWIGVFVSTEQTRVSKYEAVKLNWSKCYSNIQLVVILLSGFFHIWNSSSCFSETSKTPVELQVMETLNRMITEGCYETKKSTTKKSNYVSDQTDLVVCPLMSSVHMEG